MNLEHTQKLIKDFPGFFDEMILPEFECGDGWFDLIYGLCSKIKEIYPGVKVVQVKEKFGGLRFYIEKAPAVIYDFIDDAEKESEGICEICGKSGQICSHNNWLGVRCTKFVRE